MNDDRELSAMLRDGMAAEARQVSASTALTERMIGAALAGPASPAPQPTRPRDRGWQAWILPAAAAVLVALLASSVLIGGKLLHSSPDQPGTSASPLPSGSSSAPSSAPSSSPAPSASTAPSGTPTAVPVGPAGGPVPAGFRAADLTWISTTDGWALGTAPCGQPPCTSIVRTTDGGKSWVGIPAPVAGLFGADGCASNCLTSLRFANPLVGYAFGPSALYLTTDGGQNWRQQAGPAYALEIGDGTVLRVTNSSGPAADCAINAGCPFKIQRAVIGATSWQDIPLPSGAPPLVGLSLVRSGPLAVLTTFGHVSGGAQTARSALFVSTDDGAHWTMRADPCPTGAGGEFDTRATSSAPDGSVTVLCASRQAGGSQFTMTSTDAAGHFSAAPASLGSATVGVLAAASASTLLVSSDSLYRSTDGGRHWSRPGHAPAGASYLGFQTAEVGRAVGPAASGQLGSATVWTTTDAGQNWTSYTFH